VWSRTSAPLYGCIMWSLVKFQVQLYAVFHFIGTHHIVLFFNRVHCVNVTAYFLDSVKLVSMCLINPVITKQLIFNCGKW
jgi:hypothetical protein